MGSPCLPLRDATDEGKSGAAKRCNDLSVLLGALVATALRARRSSVDVSLLVVALLAGAGKSRGSRWYVTPFFGTCLVRTMLLYFKPTAANNSSGSTSGSEPS